MYKKDKNKISQVSQTGKISQTFRNGRNGSTGDRADIKTGGIEANLKACSAGCSTDFKTVSDRVSLAPGDKADIKTGGSYSTLSEKLYLLILIGLSVAVLLMLAGFGLNFLNSGARTLSLGSLQEHALNPADLIYLLKNNQMPASMIAGYAGVLTIIFIPAAGLIYIIGYFAYRKNNILALTAAGVLLILIMSAVIGLLKS